MTTTAPAQQKDETIIIAADDGETYILQRNDWHKEEYRQSNKSAKPGDPLRGNGAIGIVAQLLRLGTYVAYIPPSFAAAIGACCTLINLREILSNQKPFFGAGNVPAGSSASGGAAAGHTGAGSSTVSGQGPAGSASAEPPAGKKSE